MRPSVLNPLFAALSALPGIGPKLEKLFARLIGRESEPPRVVDLLFHMPTGFVVDRRNRPKLSAVEAGAVQSPSRSPWTNIARRHPIARARLTTSRPATTPTR